jgi:hypothetical protein
MWMSHTPTTAATSFRVAQDAMPVHERVARAASMFVWARGVIRREILSRSGPLPDERLKWETAMRLYGADATARALIQRMLDHVPG